MHQQETTPERVILHPANPAKRCIIWLHGLGADGNDFAPIVPELNLSNALNIRFVFPHAPIMPVSVNGGYEMRAWFDIYDTSLTARIDVAGIEASTTLLNHFIAAEVASGIPASHIILAGFSQGAVIALTAGLTYPERLGGIMALSGFLPHPEGVLPRASLANKDIPIFIAHGRQDGILPFGLGEKTAQLLSGEGYPVSWHAYDMAHSVCIEEMGDIGRWVEGVY